MDRISYSRLKRKYSENKLKMMNMKKQKTKHLSNTKLSSILRKAIKDRKQRKMDRISELPLHIIHHILFRLHRPKDITRITAWSKKWRSIWASFPVFDFDQKLFKMASNPNEFVTCVDNSLATKLVSIHSIQKFKISLFKPSINLNKWIHAAINNHVKELELHVDSKTHYLLPKTIFTSKNLTSLKLHGFKFRSDIIINLHNLKRLWIRHAHINTNLINNFIQGCPLVEDLRLTHCNRLDHLRIATLDNLRKVQLHDCHGLVSVNIELTSLVSFSLCVANALKCMLNLTGCENLESLTIKDPNLTEKQFQDLIFNLPWIKKIVLRECNRLERLTVSSRTVKKLSVIRCRLLKDPVIDAPNLSTFEYSGCKIMHVSILQISGLHEVKLHLQSKKDGFALFGELEWFLKKFKLSGTWKMVVSSNKNITIYEEVSKIQHDMSSKEVRLELMKSPMKLKNFVNNLLRMGRPKTLSLVSSSSDELLKFLKEKIMFREKNPQCCTYYSKKCWLHYITDVTMVEGGGEIGQTTSFRFDWNL